ncbi:MAG TPA: hypothetical protein VIW94_05205 [Acidimicrobiia bacterium]
MGQQPNLELGESDLPRKVAEPAPPQRWRPTKVGLVTAPDEKPTGGSFGNTGPDPGWALRLISEFDLLSDNPNLKSVVTGLTMARAAALGRAAVLGDIEVALILCGQDASSPQWVLDRRERWLEAAPHDRRPGQTAVADVDRNLLVRTPDQVRYVLNHSGQVSKSENKTT